MQSSEIGQLAINIRLFYDSGSHDGRSDKIKFLTIQTKTGTSTR